MSLSDQSRRAIDAAAEQLRSLGHHVIEADINYGLGSLWNATVRFLKGAQHDVGSMPDPEKLEHRTRRIALLGRALPDRSLAGAIAREHELSAAINKAFDAADIVMTPLCESPAPDLSRCPQRGALRSLRAANTSAWLIPWNVTGQPAISIPIGIEDGLPTSIQLVGRPDDEATLLALAAQIEQSGPFPRPASRRPNN